MKLADILAKTSPREKSGGPSANRVNYQKDWTVLRILEIHDETSDYFLVFEHFDDVVEFDSNTSPTKISFFQVKTKSTGEWKFSKLFKPQESHKQHSIISLLLEHLKTFNSNIESLNLVTNAHIDKQMLNEETRHKAATKFRLRDFDTTTKAKIKETLKNQTSITVDDTTEDLLNFIISPLSITSRNEHILGFVMKFLKKRHGTPGLDPEAFYRALYEHIDTRTTTESTPTTLPEICKQKGLCRSEVNQLLKSYFCTTDWNSVWTSFESTLDREGLPYGAKSAIKRKWKEIELLFIGGSDMATEKLQREIHTHIPDVDTIENISLMLNDVYMLVSSTNQRYDEPYIKAMTLRTLHETQEHKSTLEKHQDKQR